MTVHEVSQLTGVSVRTLHYYDEQGLLSPRRAEGSAYRIYTEDDLERLQMILLYRALEFPVKDVKRILDSPDFDRNRALEQQIDLLTLRQEHIGHLITFAWGIYMMGVKNMDFSAFDTRKLDDYVHQAKAMWGKTDAYQEFEEKQKGRTEEDERQLAAGINEIFATFGEIRDQPPEGQAAQALVERLRQFITRHAYTCTPQILRGLGKMYVGGGAFTENIDALGGPGTAAFAARAVDNYCDKHQEA
ncbi:MAG: MerR family transcriptional regulator [Clostridia bacterium]|nr:MerR family transcriptional regulator [Clostridia bacterium]